MCFGSKSKTTTPPPPQQPTRFDYGGQPKDTVARQAAVYEAQGYTNRANFGADLTSGSAASASPAVSQPTAKGVV